MIADQFAIEATNTGQTRSKERPINSATRSTKPVLFAGCSRDPRLHDWLDAQEGRRYPTLSGREW